MVPFSKKLTATVATCLLASNILTCYAETSNLSRASTSDIVELGNESRSKDLLSHFEPPISPRSILQNINTIMKNPRSIDARFLDINNLERYLGNFSYKIVDDEPDSKYVRIDGPNPQLGEQLACIDNGFVLWRRHINSDGENTMMFSMFIRNNDRERKCTDFSADTVRSIFGEPSEVSEIFGNAAPAQHGINILQYGPKTHPMGDLDTTYLMRDDCINSTLSYSTRGDGVIKSLKFTIRGRD